MFRKFPVILLILLSLLLLGCPNPTGSDTTNGNKLITSFTFDGIDEISVMINEAAGTISITLQTGTDLTGLIPIIVHTGAVISPASGGALDFSSAVVFMVTAEDGTTRSYTVTVLIEQAGTPAITSTAPAAGIDTDTPYTYQVTTNYPASESLSYTLTNAPEGMTVLPKTGKITWTPARGQTSAGTAAITVMVTNDSGTQISQEFSVTIIDQAVTYDGFFVSPLGSDSAPNNGSPELPFASIREAGAYAAPGQTIYVRGGLYTNPGYGEGGLDNDSIPFINFSGSDGNYITIKPYGNEKVKIAFDGFYGIRLQGNYLNFDGFEVEGPAQSITYAEAMADWWIGSKIYNGNGIVINGHHINVRNNIVHDTAGSAIFLNAGGDYSNITDNIIYNAAWWSTKGTTAIGMISAGSSDTSTNRNIKAERNLVFASESRIFSRVTSKGFAHLEIDEGSGTLIQVNAGDYEGRYLVKDSFYLWNGKGIAIAETDNADIENNTLYMNGSTINGHFSGLRLNKGLDTTFTNNAVVVAAEDKGYSLAQEGTLSVVTSTMNYYVSGDDQEDLPAGNTAVTAIFSDPENLDFSLKAGIPAGVGAPLSVWDALKERADEYGIVITLTNWQMDYEEQTQWVVESAPAGSTYDWTYWPDTVTVTLPAGYDFDGYTGDFDLEIVTPYIR
jgi:hypothetical protein